MRYLLKRAIDYGYDMKDILLIGMRGFELQEIQYFEKHPELEVYSSSYIQEKGISKVVQRIKRKISRGLLGISFL